MVVVVVVVVVGAVAARHRVGCCGRRRVVAPCAACGALLRGLATVLPSKLIDGDADRLVDGHRGLGARLAPSMMAINQRVAASAGGRRDRRSPSRAPVVPPCSLRGRSGPTHARRARIAGRGCAWEPSLPSPSLRATVHASPGRRDEGCLRRGLKVSGWQGNTTTQPDRKVCLASHLSRSGTPTGCATSRALPRGSEVTSPTGLNHRTFFERATGIEPAMFSLGSVPGTGPGRFKPLRNKVFAVTEAYPVVPAVTPRWGAKWGAFGRLSPQVFDRSGYHRHVRAIVKIWPSRSNPRPRSTPTTRRRCCANLSTACSPQEAARCEQRAAQ